MARRRTKSKTKKEFSKIVCSIASIIFAFIGCWMIWKYYSLVELAIQSGSGSTPDSALPIAGITAIITPIISYLLYQAKLKNSRNKYGISENGTPYCTPEGEGYNNDNY